MNIRINGKEETLERKDIAISELLKLKQVSMPDMVSVQLNGSILQRKDFDSTLVKENDQIEFLYFMGGGSSWV